MKSLVVKRALTFLIAFVLLLGTLTACGGTDKGSETTTTKAATATTTKAAATTTTAAPTETQKEREHLTLTVALWDFEAFGDDPWGEKLSEMFNVTIVPVYMSWDDAGEKEMLWASTDTYPDSVANYTVAELSKFYKFVRDKVIREIPVELVNKYPNVKEKFENNEILQEVSPLLGGYYWNPRPETTWDRKTVMCAVLYRKDWAEVLGFSEEPDNMDDLYELLRAIVTGDPDQNGVDDTYGLCTTRLWQLFAPFNAYPDCMVQEDGKIIFGYLSKNMVDALRYFRRLAQEGLIHPELGGSDKDFVSGKYGVFHRHNGNAIHLHNVINRSFGEANPEYSNPLDVIGVLGPFSENKGGTPYWPPIEQRSGTTYSYKCSDEKIDRFLEIDDYLLTEEGNLFRYWGIEGLDYEVAADGTLKRLHSQDKDLWTIYPSNMYQFAPSWDIDFNADTSPAGNPVIPLEIKQLDHLLIERNNKAYNPKNTVLRTDAKFYWIPEIDEYSFNFNKRIREIIFGNDDVQVMFDQMVADAYAAGAQKVIDKITADLGIR